MHRASVTGDVGPDQVLGRHRGIDATIVAYALRSRGFENVAVLLAGVRGWRLQRPELYGCYAGVNVTKLEPRWRPRAA